MDISHIVFWELIKDWIWVPLTTLVLSAIGWHIKSDREERKERRAEIKELHERINKEHLRVEDKYVGKDTLKIIIKQIEAIAKDVKHIRESGDKTSD